MTPFAEGLKLSLILPLVTSIRLALLIFPLVLVSNHATARVIINEVFYNAPNDLSDLEFIELYNSGPEAVDLSGWAFTEGIRFKFPPSTLCDGGGFLVLCRDSKRFNEFYESHVVGVFSQKLSNRGERIELQDASGRVVDSVTYQDKAPWPLGPDGESGSLERISPAADGENPFNWISSPLSEDRNRPMGSPGKRNGGFSADLPPVISQVKFTPKIASPNQSISVEAVIGDEDDLEEVALLYRVAGPGVEGRERALPLSASSGGHYSARIPAQAAGQLIRYRIRATDKKGAIRYFPSETEPRPALSSYVSDPIKPATVPFAWIINTTQWELDAATDRAARERDAGSRRFGRFGGGSREATSQPGSHESAFVYFDPATGDVELFDFVEVAVRRGGQKVRFQKDNLLKGMSTINVLFESETAVVVEPLAYELYRRAGMPANLSYPMRLWQNGEPLGYHLLVEQPNRAFLRRNDLDDGGNLYKILWYEEGVIGQHEKKTNLNEGHDDIVEIIDALDSTEGDQQWAVIRNNFDVPQAINFFAVNLILSHWDGFFNNYFTYHDTEGTGKWTIYPWDQDSTWGLRAMRREGGVFYDMPTNFGMNGAMMPGQSGVVERGDVFGARRFGGPGWWRPPGYFSGPLLANPKFREQFLARTKEILDTIYNEEVFGPLIDDLGDRLSPEVEYRAQLIGSNPFEAMLDLEENIKALHTHLNLRREFLLEQPEIKTLMPHRPASGLN